MPEVQFVEAIGRKWDCGRPEHWHRRRAAAENCVARQGQIARGKMTRQLAAARATLMAALRREGHSLGQIGKMFGFSGRAVSAILKYHREKPTPTKEGHP